VRPVLLLLEVVLASQNYYPFSDIFRANNGSLAYEFFTKIVNGWKLRLKKLNNSKKTGKTNSSMTALKNNGRVRWNNQSLREGRIKLYIIFTDARIRTEKIFKNIYLSNYSESLLRIMCNRYENLLNSRTKRNREKHFIFFVGWNLIKKIKIIMAWEIIIILIDEFHLLYQLIPSKLITYFRSRICFRIKSVAYFRIAFRHCWSRTTHFRFLRTIPIHQLPIFNAKNDWIFKESCR
jgi:hypothetical protein